MKATITRRVDECTFQCGYEMRRCTACGKSARTVPVLLSLECGAELMGYVCKTCVHAADLEDTRPHVHVGPEAQIVPSTSHMHLVMEIARMATRMAHTSSHSRSEEHTSELQSRSDLVCRLLLEKKKKLTEVSATWR